jgi:DNA repair protein RadC
MLVKAKKQTVTNPRTVQEVLSKVLNSENEVDRMKEHFWVIGLSTRNAIQYIDLVSLGTLNASLVHPREVFRFSILKAVSSIILSHNHPSGDSEPSEEDLRITKRLVEAGKIIGIEVLDHIVIGSRDSFCSFKERGII